MSEINSNNSSMIDPNEINGIIEVSKMLANKYCEYTDKPVDTTGEVGEFEAAILVDLELATAR